MIRIREVKSVVSAFVLTLILSGVAFTVSTYAREEAPLEPPGCTSQEGIPCTQMCGPTKVNEFKAGDENYIEMSQSRQVNMLSGRSIDFSAPCVLGYHAISGGYAFLPDGTTIDMNEITMMSQRAHNDAANNSGAWIVSIYREQSGTVDNCLNVEVRAYCVK